METFGKVYLGLTLFDRCGGYGILLVGDVVIRNETVQEPVHDELPSHGKVVGVLGTGVDNVALRAVWANPLKKNPRSWVAKHSLGL